MSKRSWMTGRAIHGECSTRLRPHEQAQTSLHPVVCTEAFYPLSIFYPPSFTRSQAGEPHPFHQRRSVGLTAFTARVAKCACFTGTPHQLPSPKENSRFPLQPPAKIPHLRTVASLHLTCRPSAKARQSGFITLPAPDRWAKTDPIHRQKPAHLTERRPASKTQLASHPGQSAGPVQPGVSLLAPLRSAARHPLLFGLFRFPRSNVNQVPCSLAPLFELQSFVLL